MHPFLFQGDKASCTRKQELFFFICHVSGLSTSSDSVPPRSEQLPGSLAKVLTLITKCNWSSCEKLLEILLKPVQMCFILLYLDIIKFLLMLILAGLFAESFEVGSFLLTCLIPQGCLVQWGEELSQCHLHKVMHWTCMA